MKEKQSRLFEHKGEDIEIKWCKDSMKWANKNQINLIFSNG